MADRVLKTCNVEWVLTGDLPPIQFCDLVTELRLHDGIVYLSMASAVQEFGLPAEAAREVRLRIPLNVTKLIADSLNQMIANLEPASDPSQIN